MGLTRAFFALSRAGFVLAREGVVSALPFEPPAGPARLGHRLATWIERRDGGDGNTAVRLTGALNRLGPSWVKLGQFLATRPDVVGQRIAADLSGLQDRMQPFSKAEAMDAVTQSLGVDAALLFDEFSEPVAAASVAQVHSAIRRRDGRKVAVKVIRPGVRSRFFTDLSTFYVAARLQERFIPAARRLRPVAVVDMLAQSARIEMDLRMEAAALSEIGENTAQDPGFRVPAVDWELTGRDCLTMDWVEGQRIADREALVAAGHDLPAIGANLVQSFLRHTLRDGFFHADMHPGNLFVEKDGTIVAVDLGITGRLKREERRFLAEILFGFIRRDYRRVAEVHLEAGYVPAHHDPASFAQAIRAIGEPIHGQSAETISMAKLLTLLFEVTELFDMETRPELILLQKTMVVVEGVARSLDPAFDMWKTAEPVVAQYIRHHLGPAGIGDDIRDGLAAARRTLRLLPQIADSAEAFALNLQAMGERGIKLDPQTIELLAQRQARATRKRFIISLVLALIAIIFMFLWI